MTGSIPCSTICRAWVSKAIGKKLLEVICLFYAKSHNFRGDSVASQPSTFRRAFSLEKALCHFLFSLRNWFHTQKYPVVLYCYDYFSHGGGLRLSKLWVFFEVTHTLKLRLIWGISLRILTVLAYCFLRAVLMRNDLVSQCHFIPDISQPTASQCGTHPGIPALEAKGRWPELWCQPSSTGSLFSNSPKRTGKGKLRQSSSSQPFNYLTR